ncbi:response regulator [Tepidibacillus marianensis]|uniref:response regulator n=1 Tax=Tepidibacillus marianensis TaxID=3131995 RepID=UPI0030D5234B
MNNVILIADDDERIRSVVKLYLEAEDFTVIEVDNGQKVLEVLGKEKVDLLLLDFMMPVLYRWTVTFSEAILDGLIKTEEEKEKYLSNILSESKRLKRLVMMLIQLPNSPCPNSTDLLLIF